MPKNSDVKTESAPKFLPVVALCTLVLGVVVALLVFVPQQPRLVIGDENIPIEIVSTPETMERGLSGRSKLPENSGMLFVYGESGKYCYWMKDMKFSIDIIWLNDQKQVVDIADNISPSTFPETFCPSEHARYVLEVKAGKTAEWGWTTGDQASF